MEFEFDVNNPELPERPPRLPKPQPWLTIFVVVWDVLFAIWLYRQPYRMSVFISGLMAAFAVYQATEYLKELRRVQHIQAEVDNAHALVVERLTMLPKLMDRHGPENAIELMQTADKLVSEGDFPDIKAAVAALERHHDFEPTTYDD